MRPQNYGIIFVFPNFVNKYYATMKTTLLLLTVFLLSGCGQRADAAFRQVASAEPVVAEIPPLNTGTDGTPTRIDGKIELDKTVHDFGDVLVSAGPLSCHFSVKNISDSPVIIYEVVSSCGCAGVEWTREPIQPGKTGLIKAVYKNEDGPYPFDKTLTLRVSALKKPVILRLRGVVHEKQRPLSERYPHRCGLLGLKDEVIRIGNLEQDESRTETVHVANLGNRPATVRFTGVSEGLSLSIRPNPIPAGETAELSLTVVADRSRWGKQWYEATPVVDGKAQGSLRAWSFTKENFTRWTSEQTESAAKPIFASSTCEFGFAPSGSVVEGSFRFANKGKSPLVFHSADSDTEGVALILPDEVPPGGSGTIRVRFDTAGQPKGEVTVILTLTTNSPLRPLVNLFLVGIVQ